jgi:cell division septum initiation protein DivIVA
MNVNELLDTIEDALEESPTVPLSGGKHVVDIEKIRDYLDEVRANLPGELRQSQAIVNDRAQIVDDANTQATAILKKAEERARILVSDAEIVKAAQQRAAEILANAQSEARAVRQTVTDYCENMLKTTEETMAANAAQVKSIRGSLRQNAKNSVQQEN